MLCVICIAACGKHEFKQMEQNNAPFKKKVSIVDIKSLYKGESVALSDAFFIEGVVVGKEGGTFYIQDKASSGLKLSTTASASLEVGQLVYIHIGGKILDKTGSVYSVQDIGEISLNGNGSAVATAVTVADIKANPTTYASSVVKLADVEITNMIQEANGKSFDITDETGTLKTFLPNSSTYDLPNAAALFTGVLTLVGNDYYVNTRQESDILKVVAPPTLFEQIIDKSGLVKTVIYETEVQLSPGVKQIQVQYINSADLITAFTMFEVDLKVDASLEVGLANNGTVITNRHSLVNMATTKNTAIAASGWEVLGGVSGDFSTTTPVAPQKVYEPFGPVIRNSVELKSTFYDDREFFGLTKDNKSIIGNKTVYNQVKSTLKEALGGRLILDKGELVAGPTARDARPGIGYTDDYKVYLFQGDGKQPTWSNGFNIDEIAKIFKTIGVNNALYLTGGDYAMAAAKSLTDNSISIISRPSWNIDAWMSSSWIITSKK